MFLRIRLSAALGNMDRGLKQLGMLLSVRPSPAANPDVQKRDLILKQRSAVICLFSAAMQQRKGVLTKTLPFECCSLPFKRHPSTGCGPGPTDRPMQDLATTPKLMILTLQWCDCGRDGFMHGPSITSPRQLDRDYRGRTSTRYLVEDGSGDARKAFNFTGRYPWQTLKRGLRLLNHILDRYELMHVSSASSVPSYPRSQVVNRFATLFNEPPSSTTSLNSPCAVVAQHQTKLWQRTSNDA